MDNTSYLNFLEDKLKDEHSLTHMLEQDVVLSKEKILKILKDLSTVRRAENELKLRNRQLEEKLAEQQIQIRKAKEIRHQRVKETAQKRIKEEESSHMDNRQIFKMYIDNTFPKHKGLLKKIMKVLFILQDTENKQPAQKIAFYRGIFEQGIKRLLDWLLPKNPSGPNKKQLAETMVAEWKKREKVQKTEEKGNTVIVKQSHYLKQIEGLEAEMLIKEAKIKSLEGRILSFQRGMQAKGGEFVAHLKKMMKNSDDFQEEDRIKVDETLEIFKTIIELLQNKKPLQSQKEEEVPLILSENTLKSGGRKKPAPLLKKNIFGYYQDPQFAGNYTIPTTTKHSNLNKLTQTLSEDLCILTLHPVIMVTLIDANIKPQRARHSLQHYVRIRINEDSLADSTVREGLEVVWNQPFLLKDYDFPFLQVQLMHKSKGLRDYALGGGKFSASSEDEKIVNVRKDKQFMGRVRFSLSYPKGNIYQFKITSVILEVPTQKHLLKQTVNIQFPFNPQLSLVFQMPQKAVYLDKSVIILEKSQENMEVSIPKQDLKQRVGTNEFTAKEGHKEIVIVMDNWKVIIQGEIYLLVCQDSQPERISQELLEGGQGKFVSIRAPPPVVTVTYDKITLNANIKFPLVFQFNQQVNNLSIVKQLSNRTLKEDKVNPITSADGLLILSEEIKAPGKIIKFFIETLQGQQVMLKHQSHLFQRLLRDIHLQISYRQQEIQQVNYARKGVKRQREKLYKQFTIQTKLLMLNHYKVFSRHFKRIGFVKFKLGYTIYDNQLMLEGGIKAMEEEVKMPQGTYFVSLQLTGAHLNSQSNSSQYTCKLNNQPQTKKIKGIHPRWQEGFTFDFIFTDKVEFNCSYQIIEHGTFTTNTLYEGIVTINQDTLQLGTLMVVLDQNGKDCLHFSNIMIPRSVYRLQVDSIEAEIEEEADWIGKIDPYLSLSAHNRLLLKTDYLDNIGSHPVWNNINLQLFISRKEPIEQEEEQIMKCLIHDYDLIGRDDYIGEAKVSTKLNNELDSTGKTDILYGHIVKDNQTCGGLRLRGKFQHLKQKAFVLPPPPGRKLQRKDLVYKLVIYSFKLENPQQFEGELGWVNLIDEEGKTKKKQFMFTNSSMSSVGLVMWNVGAKELSFEIQKQYKSFFKTSVDVLGTFKIEAKNKQFILGEVEVLGQKGVRVGACQYYIQIQSKVKYALVHNYACCRRGVKLISDLEDQVQISEGAVETKVLFYNQQIFPQVVLDQKRVKLQLKEHGSGIYRVNCQIQSHQDDLCWLKLQKEKIYESKVEEWSQRSKVEDDRQFKLLKYLHWEPQHYQPEQTFKLRMQRPKQDSIQILQTCSSIYNSYLVLQQQKLPIIFDHRQLPTHLTVINPQNLSQYRVPVQDSISKVFVPKAGALYYHLEDYNQQSVLQIQIEYLFLGIRNPRLLQSYSDISMQLGTSLSPQTFSTSPIHQKHCFAFRNISLFIGQPPNSNTIFFEGFIEGRKGQGDKSEKIMQLNLGLKLQNNKLQYRFVDSELFVAHTLFTCCLVQRKYQPLVPLDNTLYGMSFIEITSIELEVNEDPTDRTVILDIQLNQQHESFHLERVGQSNTYTVQPNSSFYTQSLSPAQISLTQSGILTNSLMGTASFQISQNKINKQKVQLYAQVKKNNSIIGKLSIQYTNIPQLDFIDINLFSYISKTKDLTMKSELQQFGPNKQKYQTLTLTSRGNLPRLESQDSFIVLSDPRDYQINVSQQDSKKLLGEFKLCHQLKEVGDKISVLQPLRTSSDSLNGVLIIEYEKKHTSSVAHERSKDLQLQLIQITICNLTFKDHYDRLQEEISVSLRTQARHNTTKAAILGKVGQQKPLTFTLFNSQNGQISILQKFQVFSTASLRGPYLDGQDRVIVLLKNDKPSGLCCLKVRYIVSKQELQYKREIVSVQASDLLDTEIFVKMKPFIELQPLNHLKWPNYVSDFGLGKENIFWKINLITQHPLDFIFKDKDIFFDDLIGHAILPENKLAQKQEEETELTLIEGQESRKGGNGKIKIITAPVSTQISEDSKVVEFEAIKISKYLLRLGGINTKLKEIFDQADSMQISIGTAFHKKIVFRAHYRQDILFYLDKKDLQIQIDTAFTTEKIITISLIAKLQTIAEQFISLSSQQHPKSDEIFLIPQLVPLERSYLSLSDIHFWMFDKIETDLHIYAVTQKSLQKLELIRKDKRLIGARLTQLVDYRDKEVTFLVLEKREEIFRVAVRFNCDKEKEKGKVVSGHIQDKKDNDIGIYYSEIAQFISEGSTEVKKVMIGKSKTTWLCLTIVQASLTKDLQWFSKMDPYCKFAIERKDEVERWRQTSVQENIGLKPIWNQTFLVEIEETDLKQGILKLQVMDSEVTVDRKIGDNKILLVDLMKQGDNKKQIELFAEKEAAGKIQLNWKITKQYIIFRDIFLTQAGQETQIIFLHQDNHNSKKGVKLELGIIYPIDEEVPIIFKFQQTSKSFKFKELKGMENQQVIFEENFASISFQVYD